jgi:hypothetical protein
MSRSYRKPWVTASYGSSYKKWAKRWANKMVRNAAEVPDGNSYRKCFSSYDICDFKFRWDDSWGESWPLWKAIRK